MHPIIKTLKNRQKIQKLSKYYNEYVILEFLKFLKNQIKPKITNECECLYAILIGRQEDCECIEYHEKQKILENNIEIEWYSDQYFIFNSSPIIFKYPCIASIRTRTTNYDSKSIYLRYLIN